ncbi:MAG: epoxyqueuosine reductase QueH [bacterium]|nr:epoxyqueuosine reductase QueH [bacterium]
MVDKKVLLHICCAPCATVAIETLKNEQCKIEGYFFNPNIYPEEEYQKRLQSAEKLLKILDVDLITEEYKPEDWKKTVKGMEKEKEGGQRCAQCFKFRLEAAAKKAKEKNISNFTTTLTLSPHKNEKLINSIGQEIGERCSINFIKYDFKKNGGFQKSITLSKQYGIYRQSYCGCEFGKSI